MVLGDYNHAKNDLPDAPGDAAKDHGLTKYINAGSIIRGMATPDIKCGKPRLEALGRATDKPMLVLPDVVVPA
jgi:hypothetical protein